MASEPALTCSDGGTCHHECRTSCYRLRCCGPLSGAFPDNEWPAEVLHTALWAEALTVTALREKVERLESRGITDMQHRIAELEAAIDEHRADQNNRHVAYTPGGLDSVADLKLWAVRDNPT